MGRKKTQPIDDALRAQVEAERGWRDEQTAREHQSRADAYCESQGLGRRPGESAEDRIKRM